MEQNMKGWAQDGHHGPTHEKGAQVTKAQMLEWEIVLQSQVLPLMLPRNSFENLMATEVHFSGSWPDKFHLTGCYKIMLQDLHKTLQQFAVVQSSNHLAQGQRPCGLAPVVLISYFSYSN